MINSRDLEALEPVFKENVIQWLAACLKVGLEILVVSTHRDDEYQDWLYASGRTRKGVIVTNARGGESKHNKKQAVDFCIMDGKKCDWGNKAKFTQAGKIAESFGLIWAGRWAGKIKETGHIQSK